MVVGYHLRARLAVAGASFSSCGGISYRNFTTALDGAARPTKIEDVAAAPDFFDDLGDRCGHKAGIASGSGYSVQLSPSSSHGACGGGGAR
jgi:hypothetical protein